MLVYIGWHVYSTRIMSLVSGQQMTYEFMARVVQNDLFFVFMVIGLAAAVYHFSNGLWNFFIKWGITVGSESQKWSLVLFTVLGWAMFFWGLASLFAFRGWWNYDLFV